MIITPQLVFMVLGIAALVAAAILLVVAIAYYFRNNIRAVRDDLSGKTRLQGGGTARGRRSVVRPRATAGNSASPASLAADAVRDVPNAVVQPAEDDLDTVLDTKLRRVPTDYSDVSSYSSDVNDDTPTVVTSLGDYHQNGMPESNMNEADMPTSVEASQDDGYPFVMTRSILAIHSNEVITVG